MPIDDIVFSHTGTTQNTVFILERPVGVPGGTIIAYSADGSGIDVKPIEVSSIFMT